MEQLEFHLSKNQTKKVLDVGTGVGNFIFLLTQALGDYEEIVGIDTSMRAVELAKGYFPNQEKIKFSVMDARQLEYPNDYFDAVCLSNSLHHLDDAQPIFDEMERVLKPKGLLIIHEMISDPLTPKQVSHKLIHHFSAEIDRLLDIKHDDTYTKAEIEDKLQLYSSCVIEDSWIPVHKEKHEFSQEEVDQVILSLDQMQNRISNPDQLPYFKQKAETIKEHIKEHGFDLATQYMFILRKNK
ncbi:MAG: methyltransferase domain-containing protein [Acholeplasmataceae bacterium]|nr:methyltransferase domain-containing protein [Acholeplasmataceae bacterium]